MSKIYTKAKRIGNEGAAYLESIMSKYCLMHKVEESKDIGNDYFCEWTYEGFPSRVPFWIQIKTTEQKVKIETISEKNNNLLRSVKITGASHFDINKATCDYWGGFQIPVYLFCVVLGKEENQCFYKRFTPILHFEKNKNEPFYQVNKENKFFAFGDEEKRIGGFVRDLFVDYIRCNYKIGSLAYKNPRELGLLQFPEKEETVFGEVLSEYRKEIDDTVKKLIRLGIIKSYNPSVPPSSSIPLSSSGSSTSTASPSTELIEE